MSSSGVSASTSQNLVSAYNVKAYGAVGDGVTDDTTAIQAAIAAAFATVVFDGNHYPTGGGIVFFPPGTYLVSTALIVYPCVHYMGAGRASSIIKAKSGSNNGVFIGWNFATLTGGSAVAGSTPFDYSIRHLTLIGSSTALGGSNTTNVGIQVFGARSLYEDLEVIGFGGDGIYNEFSGSLPFPISSSPESKLLGVWANKNGAKNISWQGPTDAQWVNVVAGNPNQLGSAGTVHNIDVGSIYPSNATGLQATNCHAWGGGDWGWYLRSSSSTLINCEGEGAVVGQFCLCGGSKQLLLGGRAFAPANSSTVGVSLGDAANSINGPIDYSINGVEIDAHIGGAIDYALDQGNAYIQAICSQASGPTEIGFPATTTVRRILVTGGGTGAVNPLDTAATVHAPQTWTNIATPAAPTLTIVGTAGATSLWYKVIASMAQGTASAVTDSAPSTATQTTTANATLSASNYVQVTGTTVLGASSYKVLKSTDGTTYNLLASGLTTPSYQDQGASTSAYTVTTAPNPAALLQGGGLRLLGTGRSGNSSVGMGDPGLWSDDANRVFLSSHQNDIQFLPDGFGSTGGRLIVKHSGAAQVDVGIDAISAGGLTIGGSTATSVTIGGSSCTQVGLTCSTNAVVGPAGAQRITLDGTNGVISFSSSGAGITRLARIQDNTGANTDVIKIAGNAVGFYGTAAQTKQTVTGSKGGNAALASLMTALSTLGLVTDSTT